jgi:hypothetical protein
VSFAVITLCVASQRVFVVVVDFVIDSVRKLFDTPSYTAAVFQLIYCNLYSLNIFLLSVFVFSEGTGNSDGI